MNTVTVIEAMGDNYIYLYPCGENNVIAIDAGDAGAILRSVKERSLQLKAILLTHHHWDHITGLEELKRTTGCEIIGSDPNRIALLDRVVSDSEIMAIGSARIKTIAAPGHTSSSVCYLIDSDSLFTGDTMFIGGCGRLFEGSADQMWKSLNKLSTLADDVKVYPGHDYTAENIRFAGSILSTALPDSTKPSLPSTIGWENANNIFLRAGSDEVRTALSMANADASSVFCELRKRKDRF
ncbi:MAG: hydroxyacylglutathione hydrolase [Anaerohalosphaera sp.]|nr:hydroxyacylglutathione hydrolase [Anaerohalosphaera sp.]